MSIIEKMEIKLKRLEEELNSLFDNAPWVGHGGTPNITDNSKGRRMMNVSAKHHEKIGNKIKQIEEQKNKIEIMKNHIALKKIPTKKSAKFIEKNPIHPSLLELQEKGLVKQWVRNPHIFFIVGLKKVALCSFDNEVHVTSRFPTLTEADREKAKELISMTILNGGHYGKKTT